MRWIAVPLALLLSAGALSAQQGRGTSLVIGGAGQVGLLFEVADRISLRPDVAYSRTSSNTSLGASTGWSLLVGIATLHTLSRDDRLRTYWTPRVSIAFDGFSAASNDDSEAYNVSVAFGAQATVVERVSVFAEVGPALEYREATTIFAGTFRSTYRQWSIANRVGVNLRF